MSDVSMVLFRPTPQDEKRLEYLDQLKMTGYSLTPEESGEYSALSRKTRQRDVEEGMVQRLVLEPAAAGEAPVSRADLVRVLSNSRRGYNIATGSKVPDTPADILKSLGYAEDSPEVLFYAIDQKKQKAGERVKLAAQAATNEGSVEAVLAGSLDLVGLVKDRYDSAAAIVNTFNRPGSVAIDSRRLVAAQKEVAALGPLIASANFEMAKVAGAAQEPLPGSGSLDAQGDFGRYSVDDIIGAAARVGWLAAKDPLSRFTDRERAYRDFNSAMADASVGGKVVGSVGSAVTGLAGAVGGLVGGVVDWVVPDKEDRTPRRPQFKGRSDGQVLLEGTQDERVALLRSIDASVGTNFAKKLDTATRMQDAQAEYDAANAEMASLMAKNPSLAEFTVGPRAEEILSRRRVASTGPVQPQQSVPGSRYELSKVDYARMTPNQKAAYVTKMRALEARTPLDQARLEQAERKLQLAEELGAGRLDVQREGLDIRREEAYSRAQSAEQGNLVRLLGTVNKSRDAVGKPALDLADLKNVLSALQEASQ